MICAVYKYITLQYITLLSGEVQGILKMNLMLLSHVFSNLLICQMMRLSNRLWKVLYFGKRNQVAKYTCIELRIVAIGPQVFAHAFALMVCFTRSFLSSRLREWFVLLALVSRRDYVKFNFLTLERFVSDSHRC